MWDEWACAAAEGGYWCLKYLHENGCVWDEWACAATAEGGYLECLKYLQNGCVGTDRVTQQLKVVTWSV